jgi:hypothetical protein
MTLNLRPCPNPCSLKPRVTLGVNVDEAYSKLGFQMYKDSDINDLPLVSDI